MMKLFTKLLRNKITKINKKRNSHLKENHQSKKNQTMKKNKRSLPKKSLQKMINKEIHWHKLISA